MIAVEKARAHLERLGLVQAAAVLDGQLEAAARKELPYADFLAGMLGAEAAARRERYLRTRTNLAHFPYQRTLEQFDFGFQPSTDERQIKELAAMAFVAECANVIFLGPPGVGKTHLAVALGLKAIEAGYGVYMVRVHDLLEDLRRAQAEPEWGEVLGDTVIATAILDRLLHHSPAVKTISILRDCLVRHGVVRGPWPWKEDQARGRVGLRRGHRGGAG